MRYTASRFGAPAASWLAACLVLCGPAVTAAGDPGPPGVQQAYFDYSRDPETVVIQLHRIPGHVAMTDTTPLLRVYGDGSVLVHYPAGMKKAGDYGLRLGDGELSELVRALVHKGVIEFDAGEAEQARARARYEEEAMSGVFYGRSSDTTTLLELRLAAYRPPVASLGDGPRLLPEPVHRKLSWFGLRSGARRHPEITSIRELAAAVELLLSLATSDDLEPIEQPGEDR